MGQYQVNEKSHWVRQANHFSFPCQVAKNATLALSLDVAYLRHLQGKG
jgi:hypothetical protein